MFSRTKKPTMTIEQALDAKPVRVADAAMLDTADGGGKLTVKLEPRVLGRWVFKLPAGATKTYEFDALGVFVWNSCDGKTSVKQLIKKLAAEFKINQREAEVSTRQFLQMLVQRRLVGFETSAS